MPRITALHIRYTELKSVSSTACQSSALIRISSPSPVTPALLTRIAGVPSPASSSLKKASTESARATSSTAPRPANPPADRYSLIARAPVSLVAVPTTRTPRRASSSAIARPMPREAPVTNAVDCSAMSLLPAACKRRVERGRTLERQHAQISAPLNAAVERGEHLARPALDQRSRARRDHGAHGVGPAHRVEELLLERTADPVLVLVGAHI